MTKKLRPFTTSTGETVMIFPISQVALTLQARKDMPQPNAPLIKIEIGGKETWERNHADPDYVESVRMWEQVLNIEVTGRLVRRIAARQTLSKEQKAEVAELREALAGEELPESDKLLWLTEIAIGGDGDMRALIQAVSGLADPAEEGVTQAGSNFRH